MRRNSGDATEGPGWAWPVGSAKEREQYWMEVAAAFRGEEVVSRRAGVKMARSQKCGGCGHELGGHDEYHVHSWRAEVEGWGIFGPAVQGGGCSVRECRCRSYQIAYRERPAAERQRGEKIF